MNPTCQYCGEQSEFVNSSEIYGTDYGMMYLCRPCNAYVGVHKANNKPLGTLANAELRDLRKRAHRIVDPLWKQGDRKRSDVYRLIQERMNMSAKEAHIAMMDESQCKQLIQVMSNA